MATQKTLVKWNKMYRRTVAEHFAFIRYHGQYFRHGEEVKCYKPLSGFNGKYGYLGLRFCFI